MPSFVVSNAGWSCGYGVSEKSRTEQIYGVISVLLGRPTVVFIGVFE